MTSDTHTIKVLKFCGTPHCMAAEEAEKLHQEITRLLSADLEVLLDFNGVETLTSFFLNVAIGRLFGKHDSKFLDARLQWIGVDEADKRVIELVIQNAKEHFKKEPSERVKQDKIIKNLAEGNS